MNNEFIEMWKELMKDNVPCEFQFRLWMSIHSPEVLREAIIRTATKNLKLGGSMDAGYRVKFCSRVANDLTFKGIALAHAGAL